VDNFELPEGGMRVGGAPGEPPVRAGDVPEGELLPEPPGPQTFRDLEWELMKEASSGQGRYTKARFSMVGRTGASPFADMRRAGRMLGGDPIPALDGGLVTPSADDLVRKNVRIDLTDYYAVAEPATREYLRRTGAPFLRRGAARQEFFEEVGRAIHRDPGTYTTDPSINKVADHQRKILYEIGSRAQRLGVKGFQDFQPNPQYLPRIWSPVRIVELTGEIGDENVVALFKGAILRGELDVTEDQATKLATAFKRHIVDRFWQTDIAKARLFDSEQVEALTKLLQEELGDTIDQEWIEGIVYEITKGRRAKGKPMPRARRRMPLDETFSLRVTDDEGNFVREVALEELFENNAEHLMHAYSRQINGAIAERKFLEAFAVEGEAAVPSWETFLQRLRRKAQASNLPAAVKPKFDRDIQRLETMRNVVVGLPVTSNSRAGKILSRLRAFNLVRVGGKFGIAQVPEIGNLFGEATWGAMIRSMPGLRRLYRHAADGKLADATLRELQAVTGLGTDRLTRTLTYRHSEIGIGEVFGRTGVDQALRRGQRAVSTASGMAHVNIAMQLSAGRAAAQNFVDAATGGRGISVKRLAELGLTPETAEPILAQIRRHATTEPGWMGRRYKLLNLEEWTDQTAAARFSTAISEWARRVIQENNIGSMSRWMTGDLGRTLLQFRSFAITSWEKQFLRGLYVRDARVWSAWAQATLLGGLAYVGLTYTNSIGRDDADAYRRRRLTPAEVGKGAFQRAGWAAMLPPMVDTPLWAMGRERVFQYGRTSGLGSDFVWGSPTGELLLKTGRAVGGAGQAAVSGEYRYSEADWRNVMRILPFHNAFVVQNVLEGVGRGLPEHSRRR